MIEDLVEKVSDGKVKVLRAGSEEEMSNGYFRAPATVTLIKGEKFRNYPRYCLVDAGCLGEEIFISGLVRTEGIRQEDLATILITHNHPDHIGAITQFPNAEVFMPDSYFTVYNPNLFKLKPGKGFFDKPGRGMQIAPKVCMISTPGHSGWDASYSYYQNGRDDIIMVGDLFWSHEDWEHDSEFTSLCVNPEMQKRSRDFIRKLKPSVVVPGHGPAFEPKY